MSTIRAQRDLREGESAAPISALYVALRDCPYQNRTTGEVVNLRRGETVSAAELRKNQCNIERLVTAKYLRRSDEQ